MANKLKLWDAAVCTGEYINSAGETKKRWENVGAVFEGEYGQYMTLKKTFNPAGLPGDRDSILISFFAPRDRVAGTAPAPTKTVEVPQQQEAFDDDIPF